MSKFIPVGFQYYRFPTPQKKYWNQDLEKIAKDGFNVVKYWLQWRTNQPKEEEYWFDDIDELMDIAQKNGLKVVLNIILDVAPCWLHEQYPDSAMITNSGEKLEGIATECRQVGGAPGPCLNHSKVTEWRMKFIEACVKRYANHPALYIWDVWNEPELSVGIKREPEVKDLLCYCDNCITEFQNYLKSKYITIESLNEKWGRNYLSFSQVEPPRRRGTITDMIDWRLFFNDTITKDFKLRYDVVKEIDKVHPIMCHTVPLPLFNSVSCCSNDFDIAKIGDLVGNSVGSNPLAADILKSCAKNKEIINSEIHVSYGNTLNGFRRSKLNDMLKHIFIPLAHGSRGFLIWQYRPEVLGLESPCWGNITLKGEDTEWNQHLKTINSFIKENIKDIGGNEKKKADVGIFLDNKNEIFSWIASFGTDMFSSSIIGAYKLFYRNNYEVEFFSKDEICSGEIAKYKAIYFPAVFYFNSKYTDMIKNYVEAGGIIITEPLFSIIDENTGLHCNDIPGCNFADLIGIHQTELYSTTMLENGYDGKVHMYDNSDRIDCSYNGGTLYGGRYFVRYNYDKNVNVLANTLDGDIAVFESKYSKGKFIVFSSLVAYGYEKYGGEKTLELIHNIVGEPNDNRKKAYPHNLRVDFVGENVVVIDNFENDDKEIVFESHTVEDALGVKIIEKNKVRIEKNKIGVIKLN